MKSTEELQQCLSRYQHYVEDVLEPARDEIRECLDQWRTPEYWSQFARTGSSAYPSPVRSVMTRIKRPERVVDKILQRPDEYPDGLSSNSFLKLCDTIGVRVIVYFLSHLPYIDRELRQSDVFEISREQPPEAYGNSDVLHRFGLAHIEHKEKESGYSSIHYILRLRKNSSEAEKSPWFEMQVRTLAQELWSEMEHILAYKPHRRADFSTRKRLQILSREIGAIDEHFNLLQEELVQRQDTVDHGHEDPLSTENLPSALAEIGLRCAQQDVNAILKLLSSRGIRSVGALVKTGTPRRVDTVRNTYVSVLGRRPENFEIIAALGALYDIDPGMDETQHIISQIEYGKFWRKFRRDKVARTINGYPSQKVS